MFNKIKRLFWKIRYFSFRHFLWKIKNAFRYAKVGYSMICSCCYNELFALMKERLKQMEPSYGPNSIHNSRPHVAKRIRIAVTLLNRMQNDDYCEGKDVIHSKNAAAIGRAFAKQRDLAYLCDLLKKDLLGWWY